MITNMKKQSRKSDTIILTWVAVILLLVIYFVTPPANKFNQLCFWGNNTKFFFAKIIGTSASTEYIFHRNNAIYLARMYPTKDTAIKEMDKAVQTLPSYASDSELRSLYKDRAEIKLFLGDYKGALNDYVNSNMINFNDSLKVAMLFKLAGNNKEALSYCNNIISRDSSAYAGFACLADIYTSANRPDVALRIWDLAIDRNKNNPRAYVDRAKIKKSMGDFEGYDNDIKIAKQYSPSIDLDASIIEEALHPKMLRLDIK